MLRDSAAAILRRGLLPLLLALALPCLHANAQDADPADQDADLAPVEEVDDGLRQRLTEREDKRRPKRPWSTPVWGRPLVVSGEYEIDAGILPDEFLPASDKGKERDRYPLRQELELEAFYSFGEPLSLFAQFRVGMDVLGGQVDFFVERGEMWLYSENIRGSHFNFDVGRLDFEDERRWWWDEDLDAVRLGYETDTFEAVLAVARELFPSRSDTDWVDPDHEGVLRFIGEISWDWSEEHGIELFFLHQDDGSRTPEPGDRVWLEREDDSDAGLTWLGGRMLGAFDLQQHGILGYWLDAGLVWGDERLVGFGDAEAGRSVVEEVTRQDVRGWGLDLGASWLPPWPLEPRIFAGYAYGSGDASPESGTDRAFRQTGLEANEAGFGGVQRFAQYGVLLDPELSNLQIWTFGAGISLFRASSLDVVYHYYRQVEPARFLRNALLDPELTGVDCDLGHGVDVVLAVEEWAHLEFDIVGSVFRAGRAFGRDQGRWEYGAGFALRLNF